MVTATLALLRSSGLTGAGINQVVQASNAPKGSVYHYFPQGKAQLVAAALAEAERTVAHGISGIFCQPGPASTKVEALFAETGRHVEESRYLEGCPVAAVTLDLDADSGDLRDVCRRVFETWVGAIENGLDEVPKPERRALAEFILSTLEGAVILARTCANLEPLHRASRLIGQMIELRFPSVR
jgi:TetR/AcrR family transcriptional repressor of lmrAB and yxaGH operons